MCLCWLGVSVCLVHSFILINVYLASLKGTLAQITCCCFLFCRQLVCAAFVCGTCLSFFWHRQVCVMWVNYGGCGRGGTAFAGVFVGWPDSFLPALRVFRAALRIFPLGFRVMESSPAVQRRRGRLSHAVLRPTHS